MRAVELPLLVRLLVRTGNDTDESYAAKLNRAGYLLDNRDKNAIDVNEYKFGAWTALHVAAMENQLGLAKQLVECGAVVNARAVLDTTPLRYASAAGHTEIVRYLLDQDPAAIFDDPQSFISAAHQKRETVVEEFLWRYTQPPAHPGLLQQHLEYMQQHGLERCLDFVETVAASRRCSPDALSLPSHRSVRRQTSPPSRSSTL